MNCSPHSIVRVGPARLSGQGHTHRVSRKPAKTLRAGKNGRECCLRAGKSGMASGFQEEPTHYNFADLEREVETLWDGIKQQPGPKEPPPGRLGLASSIITPETERASRREIARRGRPGEGRCSANPGRLPSGSRRYGAYPTQSPCRIKADSLWPTGTLCGCLDCRSWSVTKSNGACARIGRKQESAHESCTSHREGLSASRAGVSRRDMWSTTWRVERRVGSRWQSGVGRRSDRFLAGFD